MADAELLAAIKGEFGKTAAVIIERIERSEEKTKKIEEAVAALRSGPAAPVADQYAAALNGGRPQAARADESPEAFVERMIDEDAERQVVVGIRNKTSRGVRAHVRDSRGLDFIRTLRAIAVAKQREGIADRTQLPTHDGVLGVLRSWGDKRTAGLVEHARDAEKRARAAPADQREHLERAMNSSILGAGAGFVSTESWGGLVDFNWPNTVVRALGAQSIPVRKNSIDVLYIDSAAGAQRRGQLNPAAQTSVGEKHLRLTLKLISAFMAASNELLDEADISLDVFYRAMLSRALAAKEDIDFLMGLGSQNDPRGFDWWVDNTKNTMLPDAHHFNRSLATGLPTFKTVRADLFKAMQIVEESNIMPTRPGWAMNVATKYGLMRALNVQDIPAFGDEMRGGTLLGAPFATTTAMPKNLVGDNAGSGTGNKSMVNYGDWSTFVVAEDPNVELKVMDGAAYRDVNGNVITGITTNETIFVIHGKNDSGCLQRGQELSQIRSADWANAF